MGSNLLNLILWVFATIGHVGIWCVAFNRTHATALPRKYRKFGEKLVILMVVLPVVGVLWTWLRTWDFSLFGESLYATSVLLFGYCVGCLVISPYFFLSWLHRKVFPSRPAAVLSQRQEIIDIKKELGKTLTSGTFAKALSLIPGNQVTSVAIEHIQFGFKNLPNGLTHARIVHLSDFHLTGQITIDYFQALVNRVNQFEPDFIFITGDLVDKVQCLDWIDPVFARLTAKQGAYYVLGNHDLRVNDEAELRSRLSQAGLSPVNGKWHLVELNGARIAITGNELPWFSGAESLPLEPEFDFDFKVLLSHSPDQLEWAEPFQFDWMLAGHTHGGQIQFPFVGPIVAPSKFGVKYANGTFEVGSMLLHVSRGISGDDPIRLLCPPEVGFFTIQRT